MLGEGNCKEIWLDFSPTVFLLTDNNSRTNTSIFFIQWQNWYFWFLKTPEPNYNNIYIYIQLLLKGSISMECETKVRKGFCLLCIQRNIFSLISMWCNITFLVLDFFSFFNPSVLLYVKLIMSCFLLDNSLKKKISINSNTLLKKISWNGKTNWILV